MNYEKTILEMFERIVQLEEKVSVLEKSLSSNSVAKEQKDEYKESKKYRFLSNYLKDFGGNSIKLTFSEIEDILQFNLADSAKKHKEFWANSTSHSIALSWLSAGFKTVEVNLVEEFVVFEKNSRKVNEHSVFWQGFNDYAEKNSQILSFFNKLSNVTYESRYELPIGKNKTHIGFNRYLTSRDIVIEFYTRDKELFDIIQNDKDSVEQELGFKLSWKRLDDKLATRIQYRKSFDENVDTKSVYKWIAETAISFKKVFGQYL